MPHRFDATLKDLIAQHPGDFAAAFGLPNEPATTLNVDLSTISAATDVALAFGDPMREIVDLNFQSGPDAGLPSRLLLYNAAIHVRHDVAVRTIVVLLRPKADGRNLTGKLAYGQPGQRVEFEYGLVRLWQEPVESFLHGGLALLPLAPLCELPPGQPLPDAVGEVVREIERRLGKEASHAEAVRLMTASYILSGLRLKKSELIPIYKGVQSMQELTAWDEMEEAFLQGQIENSQKLLLRQGRRLIGPFDDTIETELNAVKDLDRLGRMAEAILTAKSWQELLATP